MPVRMPSETCPLCSGTGRVQISFSPTGLLYPCPECRMDVYSVTLELTRQEMSETREDVEFLIEDLKLNLRDRLLDELIDKAGEIVHEDDPRDGSRIFTARLTIIRPRKGPSNG